MKIIPVVADWLRADVQTDRYVAILRKSFNSFKQFHDQRAREIHTKHCEAKSVPHVKLSLSVNPIHSALFNNAVH
jgi:hypothetical protein